MEPVLLVFGALVVAVIVAAVAQRKPDPPASNTHHVPRVLDRNDFVRPDASWLVAVFTSSDCDTCAGVWERAEILDSVDVATHRIDYQKNPKLHERYKIDGVPTLVIANQAGAVTRAFLGPVTATDLWAAMAAEREPGSVPDGCTGSLGRDSVEDHST